MGTGALQITHLEALPTEILQAIVDLLPLWDIKNVSCTNKRLRQACMSPLFRHVTFKFSQVGIEGLNRLLESEIRSHVTSFNYEVPELLKTDILDFDRFKSNVLTPDSYVDLAEGLFDGGCEDECPSYSAIYKTVHEICREQHNIVNEGADLVLLSLFEALPQLREVKLCFGGVLEDYGWVLQFLTPDMVTDEFYQHHLQVVTSAIRRARTGGIAIHTISLWAFQLPYYCPWDRPDLRTLSASLNYLLEHIKVLRLSGSRSILKLLAYSALGLHKLDMCGIEASDTDLITFLETNKKTIQSIGFYDVTIWTSNQRPKNSYPMTASTLHSMLNVPQSTPCQPDDCGGLLPWKGGRRLLLNQDCLQRSTAKRNLDNV